MALNWELAIQNSRSFWESSGWHLAWTCRLQQYTTLDSSVGRAVDCSCNCQTSIGRWFKSGSREFFSGIICTWKESRHLLGLTQTDLYRFLDSLVVRISACHVEGPGSIPGRGEIFSFSTKSFSLSTKSVVAPGEARTHNPGITLCTVYKYRALTDCATGAYWQKGPMQGVGFEPTQSYDYESLNLTP